MFERLPRQILSLLPTLLIILILTFMLVRLIPGDPVTVLAGDYSSPEAEAALRAKLGLDRSLPVQFWRYMATVATGDLGKSTRTSRPVLQEILIVFPHTLILALFASLIALILGLPLGMYAAHQRGSRMDVATMLLAITGRSIPRFWLGVVLLLVFSLRLGWLPAVGAGNLDQPLSVLKPLILPGIALGVSQAAFLARVTRSSFLDVLGAEFIRAARAKGLSEKSVLFKHALRNSLVPVITVLGLTYGRLLGGSVVVEKVFTRPGIGLLLVNSINARDYPMVQGIVLFYAALFAVVNLVVDVSYGVIDPRIRRR